jgi:hypothetical protein
MKSEAQSFEPHLVINEISLPPAAEWAPRVRGWVFIHVCGERDTGSRRAE